MRYYCKYCGSELELGGVSSSGLEIKVEKEALCPICGIDHLLEIPLYETPEQYEKRTGQPWPYEGLVFVRFRDRYCEKQFPNHGVMYRWFEYHWGLAIKLRKTNRIVVAIPPVPPPNNWKPEDVEE